MIHRFLLLFSIVIFTASFASAQFSGTITGLVADSVKSPQPDVLVSLLKASTMEVRKTTFTEEKGQFEFSDLPSDTFVVIISQPGYARFKSEPIVLNEVSPTFAIPAIVLTKEGTELQTVVVTAKVPFVERRVDRTIVNPEALTTNAGGNALDVLSKSPGIMVDENSNVKLKGKSGVLILIDNKPTYLSGEELASYLKSLPSEAIKQIEIMTNPPAQYDAAGNAGVINIITKKNRLAGLNGNFSVNYSQGRYARTSDNVNLTYNKKKVTIYTTVGGGANTSYHDLNISRTYKNPDLSTQSVFNQNTYIKPHSEFINTKLGVDYALSEKTTLGIVTRGTAVNPRSTSYNVAEFLDPQGERMSLVIADNSETERFRNASANLNLRHQFDSTGRSLTADMDYVTYSTQTNQRYKNTVYDADDSITYADQQTGYLPSKLSIYAVKTDYTHPLKNKGRIEGGLKTSYIETNNEARYDITQNGETAPNYNLSNHFLYTEMISAAYLNYSGSWKKIEVQAGLRFEGTLLNGNQLGNPLKPASSFNRNYSGLFPTFYFNYTIDTAGNNVLNLSYGRRVNRPYFQDLNPFISPLDKYTFYEGNPYLRPTFAHNVTLSYSFKSLFSTALTYSKTSNQIQETIEIRNGIYYSRPGNIGSAEQLNFSMESTIPITKWWTFTTYSEVMYAHFKSQLYTETLNSEGTYWYIQGNNSFALPKGWSIDFSGQYITNFIDSQFSFGDYGFISLGVQKKIMKNLGTIKFGLNDMLWSNRIRGRINNLQLTDANWWGPRDTRVAFVTFSLRFGKSTRQQRAYTGNGAQDEQNRVK